MCVRDEQVQKLMKELDRGVTLSVASARSGMSRQTGAKYRKKAKLPSELKQPRNWVTRGNPFAADWKEIEQMLKQAPELQAKTIFDVLNERHPDRYEPGQLRTLQRHVGRWRALQGDDRVQQVFFAQCHVAGEAMQGDFTHTGELALTLARSSYKPLLCHVALPFSGWQWATPCQSERHRHINFVWVIFPACPIVIQAAIRALAPKGFAQLARSQASKAWVRAARLAAAWRLYRQCINKLAEGS